MGERVEKPGVFSFDEFVVNTDTRVLSRNGETIPLTPKVFEMLVILMEHPGQVVPKGRLMELLWPDSFVEESNLTQNVAVLRKALGDNSKQPKYILTIPGRGYRFVRPLHERDGSGAAAISPGVESTPERQESRARRSLIPYLLAGVAILAAIAGTFMYSRTWHKVTLEVDRTVQLTSWSGLDFYPCISPDGKSITYSSDRNGSFEIYTKQLLASAREVQLTSDGGQNFQPEFSPDGSMIAFHSRKRGGLWVVPSAGGTAKQLTDFGSAPVWSPDGGQIAFQSDPLTDLGSSVKNAMPPSTIWIVSSTGGEPRQITQPGTPPGGHGAPAWSPDGKSIVFDVSDWNWSQLAIVNVETGVTATLDTGRDAASDAIYTPDGNSIIFIANSGLTLQMLPITWSGAAAGDPVKLIDASGARMRQPSIDRTGKRIVYSSITSTSNIWATTLPGSGQELVPLTQNSVTRTSLPQISPDGKKIVYQAYTIGSVSHLWTMNSDGTDQKQISSRSGFAASWSQDGSRIYFISSDGGYRTAMWYITPDGSVERKLFEFDEDAYTVRAAPNGKFAVFASKRGGVMNLWTISMEGGEPKQLTFDAEFAGFPAISPDSNWIAFQIKRSGNTYVVVMPATGGDFIQLNSDPGQSWIYSWSPDSDKVVFAGQRDGVWNLYSVSRSTKEQQQLTNLTKLNTFVRYPSWSALNNMVVFEYSETTGNIWMAELK